MRYPKLLSLLLLLFITAYSCNTPSEEEASAPDMSKLITGSYTFKTIKDGKTTGTGTAIISQGNNNSIRIGLEDGVSFYARNLQRIDNDLVMEIPAQDVDYYGMDAQFRGIQEVSRGSSQHQGVYFGNTGELKLALEIVLSNKTDRVQVILDR